MAGFWCTIPIVSALLSNCQLPPLAVGYVEGEYLLLAPIETGRIDRITIRRGDKVRRGQVLVRLERDDARIAVAETKARLAQTNADLKNLARGRRPEEIAVIQARHDSARAALIEADNEFSRLSDLYNKKIVAQTVFDTAKRRRDQAASKLKQVKAELAVARLHARPAEIEAARSRRDQAAASLEKAEWRLEQRTIKAPADGVINDLVRRPGETTGPSAPVLSLLPQGAVKLKLYVGEKHLASLKTGAILKVHCDQCPPGLKAKISYIASEPEFTPPVIYSLENRQKLVYLIEARPLNSPALKPGQIVDVDLAGPGA